MEDTAEDVQAKEGKIHADIDNNIIEHLGLGALLDKESRNDVGEKVDGGKHNGKEYKALQERYHHRFFDLVTY